jgi:ketosteroid isomerase-like protein
MTRVLIAAMMLVAPSLAVAGPAEDAVMVPVQKFVAALNADDAKAAAATMTKVQSITDEFAPFHWEGSKALSQWFAGDAADMKTNDVTNAAVSIAAPLHVTISGEHAYVVVPMTYGYDTHGKKTTETALFTLALTKTGGGWLIAAWTYALK